MYARVITAHFHPDKLDEVINLFHESILPAFQQQKGNKGGYFLTDPKSGKAISIAIWETEADMSASENNDYLRQQFAKVGPAFASPPTTEYFVVSIAS